MFCFVLFSCQDERKKEMAREDLFSLFYGSFEEELNLSTMYERGENIDSQIFMKDGFFYISNSEAKKIMKFTSFGDLLSIHYNEQYNNVTTRINEKKDASLSTMSAIQYPFNYPSLIEVTDEKDMYIVDILSDGRLEYDYDEDIALKNIVLHFNDRGEFIDYIGQEGYGGSPFPPISDIISNKKNELIVLCKMRENFSLYYYTKEGVLSHKYSISPTSLPSIYKKEESVYMNIDSSFPSYSDELIYIKCDYYLEEIDKGSKAKKGIEYDKSVLHIFDRSKKEYIASLDLPSYEDVETRGGDKIKFKKVYELLGLSDDGRAFLITPYKDTYAFAIFDTKTQKTSFQILDIPPVMYSNFNLSKDGILSALLAQEEECLVSWWQPNMTKRESGKNDRK